MGMKCEVYLNFPTRMGMAMRIFGNDRYTLSSAHIKHLKLTEIGLKCLNCLEMKHTFFEMMTKSAQAQFDMDLMVSYVPHILTFHPTGRSNQNSWQVNCSSLF